MRNLYRTILCVSDIAIAVLILGVSTAQAQTNITGNITGPATWTTTGSPYIIKANVFVTGGALTINPGVVVKFDGNYFLNGQILANGQSTSQITFTSNQTIPTKGYWNYVQLLAGSSVTHAIVEYGKWGLYANAAGAVTIENNTIRNNERGIYQQSTFTSDVKFNTITNNDYGFYSHNGRGISGQWMSGKVNNNSIFNNQTYNFYALDNPFPQPGHRIDAGNNWWGSTDAGVIINSIRDSVESASAAAVDIRPILDAPSGNPINIQYIYGWMNQNETWTLANSPYIVIEDTSVNQNFTVTIQPGAIIKFDGNYFLKAEPALQNSAINAQGTTANPITFTSDQATPAKGDWNYLQLTTTSVLKNTVVEYSNWGVYSDQSSPTIENNTIRNNIRGIYQKFAFTKDIKFNKITNNDYGIYSQNGNSANQLTGKVNNNDIHNNSINDFYTVVGTLGFHPIDAINNWWGTTDADEILDHIHDFQDHQSGSSVHFSPFLNGSGGTPIGANIVQGLFNTNQIWTTALSPYTIVGNIWFAPNTTLTVNAGVTVGGSNGAYLRMEGALSAQGQQSQPIVLSSASSTPQVGDWKGLDLRGNSTTTHQFNHCRVEYANNGIDILGPAGATIQNCTIKNNDKGVVIRANSSPQIINNTITKNNDNIFLSPAAGPLHPNPTINSNLLINSRDYHVFAQPGFMFQNQTINAINNWWGSSQLAHINSKIFDRNDDPGSALVNFSPFWNNPGTGYIPITNVAVNRKFIDTVAAETSTISYTLASAGNVTIKIFKFGTNALVRTLINGAPKQIGANSDAWDGKDDGGLFAGNGLYYYTISVIDTQQRYGEYDPVYVPGTPSYVGGTLSASTFNPYKGDTVTLSYGVGALANVTIKVGEINEQFARQTMVNALPRAMSGNSEIWDGRNGSGVIVERLTTPLGYVFYGWNEIFPENAIAIRDLGPEVTSVRTDPYAIYPIYGEVTTIQYNISQAAGVTVLIKDPNGGIIRRLLSNQPQAAGAHTVLWDGKDLNGNTVVDPGHYRVEVTTRLANHPFTHTRIGNITVFE